MTPPPETPARVIAYHGSAVSFDEFEATRIGTSTDEGFLGEGFYFSTDPAVAFNKRFLHTRALDIRQPLQLAIRDWTDDKRRLVREALGLPFDAPVHAVTVALRAANFDGVTLDYAAVGYHHREVMVLSPEQIHDDPTSPRIVDRGTAPGLEAAVGAAATPRAPETATHARPRSRTGAPRRGR